MDVFLIFCIFYRLIEAITPLIVKVIISFSPSASIIVCNKAILPTLKQLKRRKRGETVFLEVKHTCPQTLWMLCVCTCRVAHSSYRCCGFDRPNL